MKLVNKGIGRTIGFKFKSIKSYLKINTKKRKDLVKNIDLNQRC